MDKQELLGRVRAYVVAERAQLEIGNLDTRLKPEPSGLAFDEIDSLIDRQLLTTVEGHGGWLALEDEGILRAVYKKLERRASKPT